MIFLWLFLIFFTVFEILIFFNGFGEILQKNCKKIVKKIKKSQIFDFFMVIFDFFNGFRDFDFFYGFGEILQNLNKNTDHSSNKSIRSNFRSYEAVRAARTYLRGDSVYSLDQANPVSRAHVCRHKSGGKWMCSNGFEVTTYHLVRGHVPLQ